MNIRKGIYNGNLIRDASAHAGIGVNTDYAFLQAGVTTIRKTGKQNKQIAGDYR